MNLVSSCIINELNELLNDGQINRNIKIYFNLDEAKIDFLVMGNGNRTFAKIIPKDYFNRENLNGIYISLFQDLKNIYQESETKVLDLGNRTSYSYPEDKIIAFILKDLLKGNVVEIYLDNYAYAKFAIDTIPLEWVRLRNEKLTK